MEIYSNGKVAYRSVHIIIWTVPRYGHSRYLRNHKSYKKCLINKIFINIYIV